MSPDISDVPLSFRWPISAIKNLPIHIRGLIS